MSDGSETYDVVFGRVQKSDRAKTTQHTELVCYRDGMPIAFMILRGNKLSDRVHIVTTNGTFEEMQERRQWVLKNIKLVRKGCVDLVSE